jgi:hypothetical protein
MAKLPDALALMLCERVDLDAQQGRRSLFNLFHSLAFRDFPATAPRFFVYVALYDGFGQGTITLTVTRLETEEDVFTLTRKGIAFPGRQKRFHVQIKVSGCTFEAPGRYRLRLYFQEDSPAGPTAEGVLAERFLDIYRL